MPQGVPPRFTCISEKELENLYDKLRETDNYGDLKKQTNDYCPYCSFGEVTTLDHFLPKTVFPYLSITPANLVPSCSYCNTKKHIRYADPKTSRTLFHPFFEELDTQNASWLEVDINNAPSFLLSDILSFRVISLPTWGSTDKERADYYFEFFKLQKRYLTRCKGDIEESLEMLHDCDISKSDWKNDMMRAAGRPGVRPRKRWKYPLFKALAESDWFFENRAAIYKANYQLRKPSSQS